MAPRDSIDLGYVKRLHEQIEETCRAAKHDRSAIMPPGYWAAADHLQQMRHQILAYRAADRVLRAQLAATLAAGASLNISTEDRRDSEAADAVAMADAILAAVDRTNQE